MTLVLAIAVLTINITAIAQSSLIPSGLRPLDISTIVIAPASDRDATMLFINGHNLSDKDIIQDIKIEIGFPKLVAAHLTLASLASDSAFTKRVELPPGYGAAYVVVSYIYRGQQSSTTYLIAPAERQKSKLEWEGFVVPLISLLGVGLGAWLAHFFVNRREMRQAQLDWGKVLFDKYESAYRSFLSTWSSSTIPSLLTMQFDLLRANALVPHCLEESYNKTSSVLNDSSASIEKKEKACQALRYAVEDFLFQPWSVDRNITRSRE